MMWRRRPPTRSGRHDEKNARRRVLGEYVPISVCLESAEMWNDLEDTLGVDRDRYPCCCGPVCVPGNPVMAGKES